MLVGPVVLPMWLSLDLLARSIRVLWALRHQRSLSGSKLMELSQLLLRKSWQLWNMAAVKTPRSSNSVS
ncbi:hypothetical protein FOPG_20106 [Fusarium oxysporum f. sp. conglutinans race 2 54008]|uniref:Uncharacterized protein n=1 Tax=Fusarium oxysporum f. sp. conglutinans race 2 54008 TaxID=1089457 RepID=X0GUL5_FUSOX|nr:hypothetical protein FOPG_20106 [Fusarium oxysporum f. sp. conglutinans race 2 54008]